MTIYLLNNTNSVGTVCAGSILYVIYTRHSDKAFRFKHSKFMVVDEALVPIYAFIGIYFGLTYGSVIRTTAVMTSSKNPPYSSNKTVTQ